MPEPTKEVLCFGDSNTWAYNPHTQERNQSPISGHRRQ